MISATDRKCPTCGRFAPEPDGFYDTDPPGLTLDGYNPETGEWGPENEMHVYCSEKCRDKRAEQTRKETR